jgi:hypothetical protein
MRLAVIPMMIAWGIFLAGTVGGIPNLSGWGLTASSFGLFVLFVLLSLRGEGIAQTFTLLMGLGYMAHSFGDLLYQIYPPGDQLGFADAWYYVAYAVFLAASITGLLFISKVMRLSGGQHIVFAVLFGLTIAGLTFVFYGYQNWAAASNFTARFTYALDVLLIIQSATIFYLFVLNAVRSWGGTYAKLFVLPALGIAGALAADITFAARRTLDVYYLGDPSDWLRITSQLFMYIAIFLVD